MRIAEHMERVIEGVEGVAAERLLKKHGGRLYRHKDAALCAVFRDGSLLLRVKRDPPPAWDAPLPGEADAAPGVAAGPKAASARARAARKALRAGRA
jgi:hypothetical protein